MHGARPLARFRTDADPAHGSYPLPADGLCLSTFLLVRPPGRPREVLCGRVDPAGPWGAAAALDPERLRSLGERWVLPASQLLFFEGPQEGARRVAREQLGRDDLPLEPPQVYSEAYRRNADARDPHWDLHFVVAATWPGGSLEASRGRLWRELRFVEVGATPPAAFGRGHADVLALAGLAPGGRVP